MRNLLILVIAQALGASGGITMMVAGSIVGARLAPSPQWATVPISAMIVGMALAAVPAAFLMKRIGRRAGFMVGAAIACVGSLVGVLAIETADFYLFLVAALLIGNNMGFVQQYRFAAAESVVPRHISKVVSLVIAGTLIAAIVTPWIVLRTRWWVGEVEFAGSYVALAGLAFVGILVLSRFRETMPEGADEETAPADTASLFRQPEFVVAVMAGAVGFAIMSFIMTATPVSMHVVDGFSVEETALVIQSHWIAMFLPALFSGFLIARFGVPLIMGVGVVAIAVCVGVAGTSHHFMHYWWALVLLGVGWNFLFVAATTLLTGTYQRSQRFKAQAVNDVLVFGSQASASLLAGVALYYLGWMTMNLLTLPFLIMMAGGVLVIALRQRRASMA